MTASDKFVKGETYKLEIKLVRKMDGQRVLTQFQTPVTAKLNGLVVDSADVMANSTTIYIFQTYTCDTEYLIEIDAVSAIIANPLAGEKPNYDAISGDSEKYTVTINAWYEDSMARGINSNYLSPDSYFVEGCSYHVEVTFTPKPGYKFADDVIFIINGQETTTWGREGQEQAGFVAATNPNPTYLVAYFPTEGSGTMVGAVVAENVSFILGECAFEVPAGYKFKAWAIGSPSGEQKQPGEQIIITGDTDIYAVWEELPHTHVFDQLVAQDAYKATDADCTNPATYYKSCLCGECGEETFTSGAALGHAEVIDEAVAPTCTETGLTEGKHCSVCGEVITPQEVVPSNGHSYESAVTAPTCTSGGYTTYTCSACGDSYTADEVAALGHKDEVKDHVCDACGEVLSQCEDANSDSLCDHCGATLYIPGDVDGDGGVDSDDAIYLLYYTFNAENYPLNQDGDFDGDGNVDSDDAIYLLYYTFNPTDYPLH